MEFYLIFILTILLSLSLSFSLEFKAYYDKKTLDEIRHIIISLEDYLRTHTKPSIQLPTKLHSLNQMNRAALTHYTEELIDKYGQDLLPSIEVFSYEIKIYRIELTVNVIIENGEKHNLVAWAVNAEKYSYKKNRHTPYIGGISEYAHLLSKRTLIDFISATIQSNPELKERDVFDKEVLNIRYERPAMIQVIKEASVEELEAFYYQLGVYSYKKTGNESSVDHEILLDDSSKTDDLKAYKEALSRKIYDVVNQHAELKNFDTFYEAIINKNSTYVFPEAVIEQISLLGDSALSEIVIMCEQYHRQYNNITKRLRNLTDYIQRIPKRKKLKYILAQMKEYPVLMKETFMEELKNNELMATVNQFFLFLNDKSRSDLIQLYLDIQLMLNDTDTYNDNLGKLFRLEDHELRSIINEVITSKGPLVLYQWIKDIKDLLGEDSLESFFKRHPRHVLRHWRSVLLKYRNDKAALLAFDNTHFLTPSDLVDSLMELATLHNVSTLADFREFIDQGAYSPLYGGIVAYLKVVNSRVLLTWLRKLEDYHRSQLTIVTVQGGYHESHRNISKIELIDLIMTYLSMYPVFFNAIEFDQFTGSRFSRYYQEDINFLATAACNLDGYRRRMNPQLNYGTLLFDYLSEAYLPSKEERFKNQLRFFLFTVSTSYPELNSNGVFNKVMKQFNYIQHPDLDAYLQEEEHSVLVEHCKHIEKYINAINNSTESQNFASQQKESLKVYITMAYSSNPLLRRSHNLFRLFNDQYDYFYWSIEAYLNRQNRISLIRIVNSIDKEFNPQHKEKDYDTELDSDLKEMIISNVTEHSALKEYAVFDKVIDSVVVGKESSELFDQLKVLKRNRLVQLALTAQFIYERNNKLWLYQSISDYLYIATNNELIRYILNGREDKIISFSFSYKELLLNSQASHLNLAEDNLLNILQ